MADEQPQDPTEACAAELRAAPPALRYATAISMSAGGRYSAAVVSAALRSLGSVGGKPTSPKAVEVAARAAARTRSRGAAPAREPEPE